MTTTPEATLARLREYMVGPTRFMTLLSCLELGLVDTLRDNPGMTAAKLGDAVGAKPDAVEQLLNLMVKEGFVAYDDGAGSYSLDALADVAKGDLQRARNYMNLIKVLALRQVFHLTESVRTGTLVGLKDLYGFDGNLYAAVGEHADLREAFSTVMDTVTANIDPWFFDNLDIPAGSRVLDLAGNTGVGAIDAHRLAKSSGLHVTTFDLPAKEADCLRNFEAHGVAEQCSFIGGDVFDSVPRGFDVVLIKHFLDMFDKGDVVRILEGVHRALDVGGRLNVLVPVYPEDITDTDNYNVDFFPAFFLGATMGQGGPQKLSTYRSWLEECGFTVTKAIANDPADTPPDVIPVQGILCATKTT
jgi:SAM-dependent methyltransferase